VNGACVAGPDVCKYSSDCAEGKVCVNGQCVPECTSDAQCAQGFVCTKGACVAQPSNNGCTTDKDCPQSAPKCVGGACAASCTTDANCPQGDWCDQGACVLDVRPKPNCTSDGDCVNGSGPVRACIAGYCKYDCTTDADCRIIDARIGYCGIDHVCRTFSEAHPQCTQQSDCPQGQDCVANVCK
jgi:Cys-rich repeat protein